jgi:histidinol phosphatase-like enzyme
MIKYIFLDIDGTINRRDWDRYYKDNDLKYNPKIDK